MAKNTKKHVQYTSFWQPFLLLFFLYVDWIVFRRPIDKSAQYDDSLIGGKKYVVFSL